MLPITILLQYFTPYEVRVYFGKRTEAQLQAIADEVQAMTYDDLLAFRRRLAAACNIKQHARKRAKRVWGKLLLSLKVKHE